MDSGKRITSIFIAVALVALTALAISVNRQKPVTDEPDMSVLPGLAENLRSIERLSGYPLTNIRTVRVVRTNGDKIELIRSDMQEGFQFSGDVPSATDRNAYSAILFANAAFLDSIETATDFYVVSDITPEQQLGQLVYSGFDGLMLENTVFRAQDAIWLNLSASYSSKLRNDNSGGTGAKLLSPDDVRKVVLRLHGRLYKRPDEQRN